MTTFPYGDLPGAGALDEHELLAACSRKRAVVLDRAHVEGMDSIADWSQQPMPAEACTEIGAEPNLSGFPLEPLLCRHTWLGPLMVALIGFVWLCIDGYLATPY